MRKSQHERIKLKLKTLEAKTTLLQTEFEKIEGNSLQYLKQIEERLYKMRDALFLTKERDTVSVTGQIIMENIAGKAMQLTKDIAEKHRTFHLPVVRIGRCVERQFDKEILTPFYGPLDLEKRKKRRTLGYSMIYDYAMCTGLSSVGEMLKKYTKVEPKYYVEEPEILQRIVVDLREGDIGSSLDYLETYQPADERILRRSLQTQMITDCIELGLDSYDRTVRQLKRFKSPFGDDKQRATRLVGALLVGKGAMEDDRYKHLFDYTSREKLAKKMASFFIPYEAPFKTTLVLNIEPFILKTILFRLKYGFRGMTEFTELYCMGYESPCLLDCELPVDSFFFGNHSVFACPILKEQCTSINPPMRLACGHVISKDAITRLSTNYRLNRNMPRRV
ncbi:hypothetical protein CRE_07379 [Caenorhabditis remanei]|uniref:RING-Gid-type domain-containing protein n=1 Tax=Caenorhabditis remanei TaxID=31234 RepID=E3M2L0_CAERE|nr:hypothetical protein CRE_07379 [Caenorhabditis remanei]